MRKLYLGLIAGAVLLCLTSTAEARGFRGRCGGCKGGGIFQGRIFHRPLLFPNRPVLLPGLYHGSQPGTGCSVCEGGHGATATTTSVPYGSVAPTNPQPIAGEPILVRGSDGRMYYLVPQEQFKRNP